MIFVIAILAVLLMIVRRYLPTRKAVHAARASGLPEGMVPESPWLGGAVIRGKTREKLKVDDFFVGFVAGDSMLRHGLRKGATFLAVPLNDESRSALEPGDIVVINAPANYAPVGYRLRKVEKLNDDGRVRFCPDQNGQPHRERSVKQVTAKVRYVSA